MSYNKISNTAFSLTAGRAIATTFDGIVYIDAHNYFPERVRAFSSLTEVSDVAPTDSRMYIAAQQVFGADISPKELKIGRRTADTEITPTGVADAQVYNVTITVNDGDFVVASYTAGVSDDEEAVVDGLLADITGDVDVAAHVTAAKVGTGSSAVLTISATTATDEFSISSLSKNIDVDFINDTETAADVLQAIIDEDDEFYFVTAYDKTEAFVLGMDVAATAQGKMYKVSLPDQNILTTLVDPAVDTMGKLKETGNQYTFSEFHQDAATDFVELRSLVPFALSKGGDYSVAVNYVNGVPASADPSTGKRLSGAQEGYIESRNGNYYDYSKTGVLYNGSVGKVASGDWVEDVRNRDILEATINNNLTAFRLAAPIVPYTQAGVEQYLNVIRTTLDRFVSTDDTPNILAPDVPYIIPDIDVADIPLVDKQNRVLEIEVTLYLAGVIQTVEVTGTLTFNQDV